MQHQEVDFFIEIDDNGWRSNHGNLQPLSLMDLLSRGGMVETEESDEDMYDEDGFLKLQDGWFLNGDGNAVMTSVV
jgi:hypothetical protein